MPQSPRDSAEREVWIWRNGRKAAWVGPEIQPQIQKMMATFDRTGLRPDGPMPGSEGEVHLPVSLMTDNRLPPYAARVYGQMLCLTVPSPDGPPWYCVHDRYVSLFAGVPEDSVAYSRKPLEAYGYIRLKVGNTEPGNWHDGYKGHWYGRNNPPTYELVAAADSVYAKPARIPKPKPKRRQRSKPRKVGKNRPLPNTWQLLVTSRD
jgi:hypothetical protein